MFSLVFPSFLPFLFACVYSKTTNQVTSKSCLVFFAESQYFYWLFTFLHCLDVVFFCFYLNLFIVLIIVVPFILYFCITKIFSLFFGGGMFCEGVGYCSSFLLADSVCFWFSLPPTRPLFSFFLFFPCANPFLGFLYFLYELIVRFHLFCKFWLLPTLKWQLKKMVWLSMQNMF